MSLEELQRILELSRQQEYRYFIQMIRSFLKTHFFFIFTTRLSSGSSQISKLIDQNFIPIIQLISNGGDISNKISKEESIKFSTTLKILRNLCVSVPINQLILCKLLINTHQSKIQVNRSHLNFFKNYYYYYYFLLFSTSLFFQTFQFSPIQICLEWKFFRFSSKCLEI